MTSHRYHNAGELHLDTGAMALDSLGSDESAEFTSHLASCPTCSAELTGFLETAAILGSTAAEAPPASLRESVMSRIAQIPQLPPLVLGGEAQTRPPDISVDTAQPVSTGHRADVAEYPLAPVIPLRAKWYRRPQSLLAAAAAVVVIGGGSIVIANNGPTPVTEASACVAAAKDTRELTPTVGTGGKVTVSPTCNAATVELPAMPDVPSGKAYQLWVIHQNGATSAGVLQKNAQGRYTAGTTLVHAGDTGIGVTVEPAGGSTKPTTTPIWVVPLAA